MLRAATIAVSILASSPAWSEPAKASRALYEAVLRGAASFTAILEDMADDPATAGRRLADEVRHPLDAADTEWMMAMTSGGAEQFLPFFPCRSAAVSLSEVTGDLERFLLEGAERPDVENDIAYFQKDLTECEAGLGLDPTFARSTAADG